MAKKSCPNLNSCSDDDLLKMRLMDLGLLISGSDVEPLIQTLYEELEAKQITLKPICYLADEWFVPTGETVVAIPFYLAHPRLKKLEEKIMLDVEGGNFEDGMRLLRHEAGHAIAHAFKLQKDRRIRKVFGPSSEETPATYQPKPYSRNFVQNLDEWYAQCDPDEDFAETFAVWLNPNSNWEKQYVGWSALEKLKLVDLIMRSIAGKTPPVSTTDKPFAAAKSKMLLSTYYQRKRKYYEEDYPDFFDSDLIKIFSQEGSGEMAHLFMRKYHRLIINKVVRWTGTRKYTVNNIFQSLLNRSRDLNLRTHQNTNETLLDLCAYLTNLVANYHYTGKYRGKQKT